MNRSLFESLFRFGLVGGLVTGLAYLAFMGLLRLGAHYLAASTLVWVVGVVVNYLLNRRFTFARVNSPTLREFGAFVGGNLLQLGLGSTIYWLLIGVMGWAATPAFICNTACTAAFGFVFMRWAVFPARQAAAS